MDRTITIYEHQVVRVGKGEKCISDSEFETLQAYYGEQGVPYFTLLNRAVKFCEYVGVLQVGTLTIEVLPKADKQNDEDPWRHLLIDILNTVHSFNAHAPSSSNLSLKPNSILDFYFSLYVKELNYLLHRGLSKQYREIEGNLKALKGNLRFSKHLQHNLIHKERFYVKHTIYDKEHKLHYILHQALLKVNQLNSSPILRGEIDRLLLTFPEGEASNINEASFERIVFNRKTEGYRTALEIAHLILLNYHPDLSQGNRNVLALMFDMNALWEAFVLKSLRKHSKKESKIKNQVNRYFWKPYKGSRSQMRPDIVIHHSDGSKSVLDTKWKNLNGKNPSPDDLRQMYVYLRYFHANKVALVYPGSYFDNQDGYFIDPDCSQNKNTKELCSIITIATHSKIDLWQQNIANSIWAWSEASKK